MSSLDLYIAEVHMKRHVSEARQEADEHAASRQAERPQGWLARQGHSLLFQLGGQLVAMGERLNSYGMSPNLSPE